MLKQAKSMLSTATRAIAVVLVAGCMIAGSGSVAGADEFILFSSSGEADNTRIRISTQNGNPIQDTYTDHLARFFYPYSGQVQNLRIDAFDNTGAHIGTGDIFVNGARGARPATLGPPQSPAPGGG